MACLFQLKLSCLPSQPFARAFLFFSSECVSDLGETATANFTNSLIVVQSWLRYRDIGSLGSCRSTKDFHRSCAAFGKKSRKSSPLVSAKSVHKPSAPRSEVVNWRNHQSPGSISSLWLADASRQHPLDQIGRGTSFRQSQAHCLSRCGSMLRPARRQVWQFGFASRSAPTSSGEGRQLTPVEGASGAAVARRQECFLWQEWRLVETFQDSELFDLLAPQTMPQDAQQPLPVSQKAAQQRQLRLQSGIKDR